MTFALSAQHLSQKFGAKHALKDVSLNIAGGEFVALLGPNGAGKTTLYSLLTGLRPCSCGSIELFGHNLKQQRNQALQHLGIVFQQSTLDLDLTVEQNLIYHSALHGLSRAQRKASIDRELERMNLLDSRRRKVRSLNGGHRRRVEIARALLHQPGLLLLDEPTVGLDLDSRESLNQHVRSLCKERRIAVLWSTHLIDELSTRDRLLMLHNGCLKADGIASDLMAASHTDSLRQLFSHHTEVTP